jgi:hypothetical protein
VSDKDGGPAFSGAYDEVFFSQIAPHMTGKIERRSRGMSLRDYFAAQALMGLLNRRDLEVPCCASCRQVGDDPGAHYADLAYRYADAMLMERAKR